MKMVRLLAGIATVFLLSSPDAYADDDIAATKRFEDDCNAGQVLSCAAAQKSANSPSDAIPWHDKKCALFKANGAAASDTWSVAIDCDNMQEYLKTTCQNTPENQNPKDKVVQQHACGAVKKSESFTATCQKPNMAKVNGFFCKNYTE